VQGLKLDWTCVTWNADLRYYADGWAFHDFRGKRWTNVHSADGRRYLLSAYRVLCTRARQGMVIFVPPGDGRDPTRAAGAL
jgi:schlafen family protein